MVSVLQLVVIDQVLAESEKLIELKALTFTPPKKASSHGFTHFVEMFNEKARGRVKIVIAGGPEIVPARDQSEALKTGVIDLTNTYAGAWRRYLPDAAIFFLSRLSPWEERESGFYDFMAERFRTVNAYYLGRGTAARPFYIFTTFKAEKYQDLAGHKMAQFPLWVPIFKALGCTGVSMPMSEMYTSMERGLTEGVGWLMSSVIDHSMYEVLNYIIYHPISPSGTVPIMINLDSWNKLPDDIKNLMIETQQENEKYIAEYWRNKENKALETLMEKGMETIKFSSNNGDQYLDTIYEAVWSDLKPDLSPGDYEKWRKLSR
jgi:TRAP-type C4-dicarboxylate transport system substrate-binding protein